MPVRGWLLLLCIMLTGVNPATLAVVAASRVGHGGVPTVALVALLLGVRLVVTSVGVAAGLALWHKRAGAVVLAKASLVLLASRRPAVSRPASVVGGSAGMRLPGLRADCLNAGPGISTWRNPVACGRLGA